MTGYSFNQWPLDGLDSDKPKQAGRCCFVCLYPCHLAAKFTDFGWGDLLGQRSHVILKLFFDWTLPIWSPRVQASGRETMFSTHLFKPQEQQFDRSVDKSLTIQNGRRLLVRGPITKFPIFLQKKQFVTNGDFGKNSFLITMMDDIDSRCFHAICHGFITGQKY